MARYQPQGGRGLQPRGQPPPHPPLPPAEPPVRQRALTALLLGALSDEDRAIGASAITAVRQSGAAVGAAVSGLAANLAGFSGGLTDASARAASVWIFLAVIPLALAGAWAAFRLTGSAKAA